MMIDIIVGILLIMAIFKGIRRGLIVALFSIIAFIIGLAAAMKLSVVVANYLKDSVNISAQWWPVVSFLLVFVVVVILIRLMANMLEKAVEWTLLGWVNKLGGVILYVLMYIISFSVLLFFAEQIKLINKATIDSSVTYPLVRPWGPWAIDTFGALIPWFKDMFSQLEQFFDRIALQAAP
jgi:membrane protein required for colicin V production